ncbi:4-(cytidine 5'-diphospho)-2-C-methyl-D-erythritol kinase [Ectothiorhodospira lacustris]|uniref:4-(cytidine 5'-diphospho)-2-C-methyl-D-erythritol kinase n=1 Tax=Ectothiorhodospira lacustris TaxID=2899127 RepID=UPI001EE93639|nr:4-(cytidine 5'-diphospho)-2-C-methyl-D-erythritol kinase [Ectothiorhodospira lacustris]MCG5508840.1 4-(cytidine 5'-diphospho)-2-C-methyl-D-erythritol kinase [Ectothiorhodospira lacustris]MCG5520631.1 4-(cytidine 5'-diphospho)-2-C-methyl-D-erythritol kinase [Ectothiorhodospira lacustris]
MTQQDPCMGWPAPAKLNLFLHITGRRPDGYHELQSVFQFLTFGDTLDFRLLDEDRVRAEHALDGVAHDDDLTVRAARTLKAATGHPGGVAIRVRKRLPMGGGLGGGSSDAATVLVALNALWETGLDDEALAAMGLKLGADVPVFVRGHAAWAEGVGERLAPVSPPEPWYLVVHPGVMVPTGAIFTDPGLTRDCPPIKIADFLAGRAGNVCEPVVCRRFPAVAKALEWLQGQGVTARMTGTGSCVFGVFETEEAARAALECLPCGWSGFVARGCNQSPLHRRRAQFRTAPAVQE